MNFPAQFDSPRLHLRAYTPLDGPLFLAVGQKNREHLQRYESGNFLLHARDVTEAEQRIARAWIDRQCLLESFDREVRSTIEEGRS